MIRITALRLFARWWVDISIALIVIGAFGIALNDGVTRIAAIFNPFNAANILAIVGLFIPALVASKWAKSLENAAIFGDGEAQHLVDAYCAVLMSRLGLERISPDTLPTSKAKMKEAIRYVALRSRVGPDRETLASAYVSLADFQANVVSMETQIAERAELAAEWKALSETHPIQGSVE